MRDRKEYNKQYYIDNKEKHDERHRLYRKNNPEEIAEMQRLWRKDNPEYNKLYKRQYYEDNLEYMREYNRGIYYKNPGRNKQYLKTHPEKRREQNARNHHNRRDLGFNPLNECFRGSEAHHINNNDVVYILKELHRSIWHCLKTGKGMERINQLAMENIR